MSREDKRLFSAGALSHPKVCPPHQSGEASKDKRGPTLGTVRSQPQGTQALHQHKVSKKKDPHDIDKEGTAIQSKLKKLIGANRTSAEAKVGDKPGVPLQRESINVNDSGKKDKRDRSLHHKKNVKLNISTESITKFSPETVEAGLSARFPATAPNRDTKDKKLFAALKKDTRHTPKTNKKLPEELTKKIQKSNLDILAAFKSSAAATMGHPQPQPSKKSVVAGQAVQTPTGGGSKPSLPSAMLKALKKPPSNPGLANWGEALASSSTPQGGKNKSFRADRLADYMKNNFFVKNNYFHPRDPKADPSQKSASSIKNKTTDGVVRQVPTAGADRSDRGSQPKPPQEPEYTAKGPEMIAEDDAGRLNIEDITFVEKRLNTIAYIMEKDFEIYDQIKEYVDIVQEESFSEFFTVLKNPKVRQTIKNSMVLERWAMFFVFFFYFNQDLAAQVLPHLKELVQLIHRNVLCYLRLFSQWISVYEHLEPTYKSLNNLILKRHMECPHVSDDKGDDVRKIKKNNLLVLATFRKTMHLVEPRIREGLADMFEALEELSLKDGLESCLDSFCQFLIEKGVVSVEYTSDNGRKQETPETDVTKGQEVTTHPHNYGKPDPPFLPTTTKKYTLVMDLDETLVHYEDNGVMGQFYLRPYAQEFIEEMSKHYEVVIFTAALQDYADWIIDRLDSSQSITHRLYRQHTSATNGNYHVKDLSKLGRDLARTIIVDNIPENFQLQAENGIFIKSWFKDPDDSALFELMPLLREIAVRGVPDVRVALKRFRDKMIENIKRGCLQPHLNLTLE